MLELTTIPALRAWVRGHRSAGRRIALVPTMGALHEGHLALVDEARRRAQAVVVSIFVNPLQFGPTEDLARYPRDLPGDRTLASSRGVDALFLPDAGDACGGAGQPFR
jgi:pantoate--beta-alanine ligase